MSVLRALFLLGALPYWAPFFIGRRHRSAGVATLRLRVQVRFREPNFSLETRACFPRKLETTPAKRPQLSVQLSQDVLPATPCHARQEFRIYPWCVGAFQARPSVCFPWNRVQFSCRGHSVDFALHSGGLLEGRGSGPAAAERCSTLPRAAGLFRGKGAKRAWKSSQPVFGKEDLQMAGKSL